MNRLEFQYPLPEGRIAQEPIAPRDHARLMALDRTAGSWRHLRFDALPECLRPGDLLVTNVTRVFPARLRGMRPSGGKIELLLTGPEPDGRVWRTLLRGSMRPGAVRLPGGRMAELLERLPDGEWRVRFSDGDVRPYLESFGEMPLPPYIKRPQPRPEDRQRYQTVFARTDGAIAAPTAGFHFTPELLNRCQARGIERTEITLHVGWGTFQPVRTEQVEAHQMAPERYDVSEAAAEALTRARREGRRIVAVGTTCTRTLETIVRGDGTFAGGSGMTDLFIYPGYRFKAVDALITNFHLPDSTPLLLACAFFSAPHPALSPGERDDKGMTSLSQRERVAEGRVRGDPFSLRPAYEAAIAEGYRFYSYGDAMLIQ